MAHSEAKLFCPSIFPLDGQSLIFRRNHKINSDIDIKFMVSWLHVLPTFFVSIASRTLTTSDCLLMSSFLILIFPCHSTYGFRNTHDSLPHLRLGLDTYKHCFTSVLLFFLEIPLRTTNLIYYILQRSDS
jgi:hypothetical protein